jgi:hypothetical protein
MVRQLPALRASLLSLRHFLRNKRIQFIFYKNFYGILNHIVLQSEYLIHDTM